MPLEAWYLDKAEQCVRLANAATDARHRLALQQEAARWREIASDIARQERADAPP